jgi:hypothetical protein
LIFFTSSIFHVELYMSHSLPLLLEKVLQRNSATACKSKENKFENVPIRTTVAPIDRGGSGLNLFQNIRRHFLFKILSILTITG